MSDARTRSIVLEIEALYRIGCRRRLTNREAFELGELSNQLAARAERELSTDGWLQYGDRSWMKR